MEINNLYNLVAASDRNLIALDINANNIANASTPGYKADRAFFVPQPQGARKGSATTSAFDSIRIVDFTAGSLQRTGNLLDLAIEGRGFFSIQGTDGEYYTKKGNFTLDKDRRLVTMGGLAVMGENGSIKLPPGRVEIGQEGEITVAGAVIARLKISAFADESKLIKIGDSNFRATEANLALKAENVKVHSGYLEMANVAVMKEMVEMIALHRRMELFQKAAQTIADLDKNATNRIGRLA